ncbi:calcium/calmodulin-dependent serine/threonine-protein kinase 1-like isoform 1 [Anopheles sinensis]|uniref:Calcium/calmodulin-dependent serine/threonine-protein kinase 1-like isoform 1 n=1 Tax=Anopheles sinensis TaxID=74873 RepID=A0A084WME6_ANOSI|nr:calcium/calmodulin-dependent serine/threonine-protein kinase 1-like isoform 1 [Anopheles sinensis]
MPTAICPDAKAYAFYRIPRQHTNECECDRLRRCCRCLHFGKGRSPVPETQHPIGVDTVKGTPFCDFRQRNRVTAKCLCDPVVRGSGKEKCILHAFLFRWPTSSALGGQKVSLRASARTRTDNATLTAEEKKEKVTQRNSPGGGGLDPIRRKLIKSRTYH